MPVTTTSKPTEITLETLPDLFAYWRELAGGFRMEKDDEDEGTENQPDESTEDEGEEGDPDEKGEEGEEGEGKESELTREQLLDALNKKRKSEGKYRTRLRELEARVKDAKTPEEFEAAVKELTDGNAKDTRELLVENVALRHKLPDELRDLLKGDTREELVAHAKSLAKFATKREEPDLSGGLNPGGDESDTDSFDPAAVARQIRKKRY